MKDKILAFIEKYKKYVIIAGIGLGLIIIGSLSWTLVFSKYNEFYKEEKAFTKAVKRYYEYHTKALPQKGESKDLTLQDLYDKELIDDLYVPSSRKMCDTSSWVRVYMDEEGEYKYITYLKCGRYSSRIDHEGPKITLNGDAVSYMALDTEYQEEGVKEINDNKDGKMDIAKVTIDSSNVNTKKIGTYKVTYTIKDSHYNKTVVTRQVVVTKGFSDTVRKSVSSDGYYKGTSNNYVLFSGMLFRIVRINEDDTVKLVLDQPVNNMRANYEKYEDSNIDTWLNKEFLNALTSSKYLVDTNYCVGSINSMADYTTYCSETVKRKVGLLDVSEYYNTYSGNTTSILSKSFTLGHKIGDNYADATFNETAPTGTDTSILAPIRPVITVASSLSIMSGDGSITKPYKLNDYEYANKTDRINTRLIGEYLEYSGLVFRINQIDTNKNVRVILDGEWIVKPDNNKLYISTNNIDKWSFNVKNDNEPGYVINNDYLDFIDVKSIKESTYEIPTNDKDKKYNKYKASKIKAKIVLPKTYDLFAATGTADYMYAYIDKSTNNQMLFMINTYDGRVFEIDKSGYNSYSIKIVTTLDGNLKIESGKGTVNSPYKLR